MPRRKFDAWLGDPHARLAVVGASGWIGAALTDQALAAGLPPHRLRLFTTKAGSITIRGAELPTEALTADVRLGDGAWQLAHAAVIGPDRVAGGDPAEVRRRNEALMQTVFGMAEGALVKRLVMLSSGAAHRPDEGPPARAAYARLKRDQEDAVLEWAARTGSPVLLPRVFNLGGPYMTGPRRYALGDFIISLAAEGRIAIGAADPVVRNYVHVLEMAGLLLDMAVDDAENAAPFDIGGTEAIELGDLARRVAKRLGVEAVVERPPPAGGPGDRYVGDGERYQRALAATGRTPIGLDQIIDDTIAWLRQAGAVA